MGNTNSTEAGNNLVASYQRRRSRSSSSASIQQQSKPINTSAIQPTASSSTSSTSSISKQQQPQPAFNLSVTEAASEPILTTAPSPWSPKEPVIQEDHTLVKEIPINNMSSQQDENKEQPEPAAVPVSTGKKSGWVSSTGAASPWYGSLSSSTSSSHHRASISGPYYRTRGMSVTRDSENDEELTAAISSTSTTAASTTSNSVTNTAAASTANTTVNTQQKINTPPTNHGIGVPTIITWAQGGNNVYVTGTFNGWKHKIKLIKSTHDFSAVLELPPGTHRLKFIVDDEWKCSNEMETATDPDGNLVNYLQVMDEEDDDDDSDNDEFGASSADKYSNIIPPELLQLAAASGAEGEEAEAGKKSILEYEKKQPQPPYLPPHLEKVLLNSNIVSEEDNSVLHEPNHVTLNHLYACSIKDNVMALATTSRYRKKYVTTMYYRPVFPKN